MQISKELLDKEIEGMQSRLKLAEAQVNQITGASLILEGLRKVLDMEEPKEENKQAEVADEKSDPNFISQENAERQRADEARALSIQEIAELVAGEGATAEEPVALSDEEAREFYPNDYD